MNEQHNPYTNAMKVLQSIKRYVRLPEGAWDILEHAEREIIVHFPVRMDDGHVEVFEGMRIQHNSLFGPSKGGVRFHPAVNSNEVRALAFWMMIKNTIAGIPMGGGKGGIAVDPKMLSEEELEQMTRNFIRVLTPSIGPRTDTLGPDMGTPPRIMAWMADAYRQEAKRIHKNLTEGEIQATFSGKPLDKGGSQGREEATARGGMYILATALAEKKLFIKRRSPLNGPLTVAVQGFGNLGYHFARIAHEEGFRVIAVSDSRHAIHVPQGLDPVRTMECRKKNNGLIKCFCNETACDIRNGKPITNEQLLQLPVDILVPAAIENVITGKNAHKVNAAIVLEMANGPTTPEADEIIRDNHIVLIPDVLANSGGVIVSYFEWLQNLNGEKWTIDEVRNKLKKKMIAAWSAVWEKSVRKRVDLRTAAYILAVERLAEKIKTL